MNITVLFFASVRQAVGQAELRLEMAKDATIDDLRHELQALYPATERLLGHARWAVNEAFVEVDQRLEGGDTVAVIGCLISRAAPRLPRAPNLSKPRLPFNRSAPTLCRAAGNRVRQRLLLDQDSGPGQQVAERVREARARALRAGARRGAEAERQVARPEGRLRRLY